MTEIESKIAQRLNNSIERIVPNNFDTILSATSSRIATSKRRHYPKFVIAALSLCVIITCGIIVNQVNAYRSAASIGYEQKITSANCQLYFNENKEISISNGLHMGPPEPIYSNSDIIRLLGADPLKNVWIPSGLKSNFAVKNKNDYNSNHAYLLSKKKVYYMVIDYVEHPNSDKTKSIDFALSHHNPFYSDIELTGKVKTSYIYKTKVILTYHPANAKYKADPCPGIEIFGAKFSYKEIGYSVYAQNGFTQQEFIKVLTSIIKS